MLQKSSRMAESKIMTVVLLSSTDYSTWKVQCKMASIRYGLGGIVSEIKKVITEGVAMHADLR